MKKYALPLLFLSWTTLIVAAFFVVQKPDLLQIPRGIAHLLWTIILPAWMAILAGALGGYALPQADPTERLTIGAAIGLAVFGLAGFGLALAGLAKPIILLGWLILATALLAWTGKLRQAWSDLRLTAQELAESARHVPRWIPIAAGIALTLAFLLSLAPPVEDFDALFYHLTVPSIWLKQGADISFIPIPHYWYPQIVEGMYVWPLSLGTDTATHLIHLTWLALSALLLWHWAKQLAGDHVAWNALALLLTMPSLAWLAAWAYTDYALTFAGLASLYALWRWKGTQVKRWLVIGGLMAGMAVSVKYTGFIAPVTGVLLLLFWDRRLSNALFFGVICTLAASPWYLRNWIGTGNPLYPFIFGGLGWDSFLAQAYAASGTGLGWDPASLLTLPLIATLGTKDANYYDGRIGPFFLILLPLALLSFWEARKSSDEKKSALQTIGIFSLIGASFWTLGVVNSAHLFQTRLLFPVLLPLTIPFALGLNALPRMDLPQFKASFIARAIFALVVTINLVNLGLQITTRNPLAVALGIMPRDAYIAKRQPGYASALNLISHVPRGARVYFLFEPRSYGMSAVVQADSINANFEHDVWLYRTPEAILAKWREEGFTHVLIFNTGASFVFETEPSAAHSRVLDQVKALLLFVESSPTGDYTLYQIP